MKGILKIVSLAFFFAFALALFSCSNGSDGNGALLAVTGGGGTTTTPETDNDGGTTGGTTPTTPTPTPTPTPTSAATYVITFNANDGSENPATATQSFIEGTPQALKPITELGFSKEGFNFAGWGMSADATESVFANETEYTASADITFYALWSAVPVYSVIISSNEYGTITPSPATGGAGTEITLSNLPNAGYQFASYTVTDADGVLVTVTDGKFTLPAKNVSVTASFNAIYYNINVGTFVNGRVTANSTTATIGSSVTLTVTPASGYQLTTLVVADSDGISVVVNGTGNSRTFSMPAKNVTVTAGFSAINYNINVGTTENGSVIASPTTATVGTCVTLTATPASGYQLSAVTVTAEGGTSVSLSGTGNSRSFIMPAKSVTVSVKFLALPSAASGAYTKIETVTINGRQYDIVTFGLWPQTIKAANISVNESETKSTGAFTYCRGSDGEWYAKIKENAYGSGYKYSDGTTVGQGGTAVEKWFKVEPIKWRVLTADYNETGKKLLFAENILANEGYYNYSNTKRTIGGKEIHPNNYEYSRVRAFLNGLSYQTKSGDYATQVACDNFLGVGFLQTAFNAEELAIIQDTSVDNSARSTNPDANAKRFNRGDNISASDTPTNDKVFLLSMQEATTSAYGFDWYNAYKGDDMQHDSSTRIRQTTDYAKACGAKDVLGGWWWLRSPYYLYSYYQVYLVLKDSGNLNDRFIDVNYCGGIVPALCVSN